jgi:hypothetical protein
MWNKSVNKNKKHTIHSCIIFGRAGLGSNIGPKTGYPDRFLVVTGVS